jgi:hypothetical protein
MSLVKHLDYCKGITPQLIISKPPSLLRGAQSFTITGIIESLPIYEPPKVQKLRKQKTDSP